MNECPYCDKPALSIFEKFFRGRYPFNSFKCRNCGKTVQVDMLYSLLALIPMGAFMAGAFLLTKIGYELRSVFAPALFIGFTIGVIIFLLKAPIITK